MKPVLAAGLVTTTLVLFVGLHFLSAEAKLRLEVRPQVSVSPITEWHLRVWCPKHPDNRLLRIDAVGDDWQRSSEIQLDGDTAPVVHDLWWHGPIPCGVYALVARSFDSTGRQLQLAWQRAELCVDVGP